MYSFGVDIFVIDAFNKVRLPSGNRLEMINDMLSRLTSFCQVNNVSVILVAHPTKMKKNESGVYDIPTLYDVSGSADFRNQTHNGFAIHRYFESENQEAFTKFVNLKTKFSFQGEIGQGEEFLWDEVTGRMYAKGQPIPTFDLTLTEEPKQTTLKPNRSFDKYSEFDQPMGEIEF
jgi:twinkle protein